MEKGTVIGFGLGIIFIILSISMAGKLIWFIDIGSIMITIGGAFSATLISFPLEKFTKGIGAIKYIFKSDNFSPESAISKIIELANVARKDGLLALEEKSEDVDDEFLKKGIGLLVDGTHPDLVRSIMETELAFLEVRHKESEDLWGTIASMGPAWGMIGTLIGLICMLQQLDDPSSIGPSMGIALITTMYGSVLANLVATPTATKLKIRSAKETLLKEVMIEGLLSIQAGENPRIIEEKLKAFLSPAMRNKLSNKDKEEQTAETTA